MTLLQIEGLSMTDTKAISDSIAAASRENIETLKNSSFDEIVSSLVQHTVQFAIHLFAAIVVFYIGKFIITKLYNFVSTVMVRRHVDRSLCTFVLSLVNMVMYFILIVIVIGILGIETSSFIAIFASAGVAVGLALSGTLQNFAGGVLILLLKPYKIGDYIEAQGYSGTVTEIQIFNTIICTPDNKSIIIPNGGLSTSSINNWSREHYRRVDWSVGISYGDSVETAREAILAIINSDERIVKHFIEEDRQERLEEEKTAEAEGREGAAPLRRRSWMRRAFSTKKRKLQWAEGREGAAPLQRLKPRIDCSPVVFVNELADSSVNLTVRAWTRSSDYWGVFFAINERIYTELPAAGISFPFPQMDVHLDK